MKNIEQKWTEEEVKQLRKLAKTMPTPEIAIIMGRSRDSVKNKMDRAWIPRFIPPKAIETPAEMPEVVIEPVVVASVPEIKEDPKPVLHKPVVRDYSVIEWCPECHSPVSNWTDHQQRLGHKRPT